MHLVRLHIIAVPGTDHRLLSFYVHFEFAGHHIGGLTVIVRVLLAYGTPFRNAP